MALNWFLRKVVNDRVGYVTYCYGPLRLFVMQRTVPDGYLRWLCSGAALYFETLTGRSELGVALAPWLFRFSILPERVSICFGPFRLNAVTATADRKWLVIG